MDEQTIQNDVATTPDLAAPDAAPELPAQEQLEAQQQLPAQEPAAPSASTGGIRAVAAAIGIVVALLVAWLMWR